ncbi:MAG TPA: hypothetical protein VK669_01975 [Candidatus Limnocylindrales bacterium]|nr:hypothetical protein [Candidatus Limnocylindrales bacterium]
MEVSTRPQHETEPAAVAEAPPAPPPERWSPAGLIAFRFAFVYLLLYCYPSGGRVSLLEAIPFLPDFVPQWAAAPWRALCSWVAVHVFHLSGPVTQYHPTGSGDTTLDYVQVFCFVVIAALATVVWSVLDRRRTEYTLLYPWLRLVVRFTLAFTLLSYGFAKIYPLQFGSPALSTLVQTYGESSPMRLLWTFMAASPTYTIFGGLCEAGAGTLLLFRRTAVLGAMASAAVMLNVAVLNYAYDVPVKLYSTHLVLMSVFLLVPELPALWRFFVLHAPAQLARVWLPAFERRWLRITAAVLQVATVVSVLGGNIWGGYAATQQYAQFLKQPAIYGVWDVDTVGAPWKRLVVNSARFTIAIAPDGARTAFFTRYGDRDRTVDLTNRSSGLTVHLSYTMRDPQHVQLTGTVGEKHVVMRAHRTDTTFLLTSRGFHWISEDPYNR